LKSGDPAENLFNSAKQNVLDTQFLEAENDFKEIIEEWPESKYIKASIKELLGLKHIYDQDYFGLQDYFESVDHLWENEELMYLTEYIINRCDVCLENYTEAIAWYEDRIINPISYEDSICSVIDLGHIYTLMEETGSRWGGYSGMLPQHRPESYMAFVMNREELIDLLPKVQPATTPPISLDNTGNPDFIVYPNPPENIATIVYSIPVEGYMKMSLYEANGSFVDIIDQSYINAGHHTMTWNTDSYADGLYILSLEVAGYPPVSRRVVLSK
jgi:hypothetical protein